MWIILPFLAFFLFWLSFSKILNSHSASSPYRQAFLLAAGLWGTIVFGLTEVLSLFHGLSFWPLFLGWLLVLIGALYGYLRIPHSFKYAPNLIFQYPLVEKILWILIVSIAAVKGYSAIFSAPNTSDAMTYHLSRVEHWIQNGSVENYPTHVLRQLYVLPWPEYVIAHLRLLSGGDYFSNAVQWFSAVGSWIGVSCVAQMLGANGRGQLLAALLAATLPMGLVQATSTQTDYVMTFWLVAFVYQLLRMYQQPQMTRAWGAGMFLGLALLSKGNVYVFAPVWIVVYIVGAAIKKDIHRFKCLGVSLGIAIIFIVPFAFRNMQTFGNPYWTHVPLINKDVSVGGTVTRMVDNTMLHLSTPWQGLNQTMQGFIQQVTGSEVPIVPLSTGEDDTGNGIYLALALAALVLIWFFSNKKERLLYALGVAGMWIGFCVLIIYQPWNSRFHLAIFVFSCALTGAVLSQLLGRFSLALGLILIVLTWPWLWLCNEHPLGGKKSILVTKRYAQYFSTQSSLEFPYTAVTKIIEAQGCREIGIVDSESAWEYPWWVSMRQLYGNKFRLEHVEVKNISSKLAYPQGSFTPCMIISSRDPRTILSLPQGTYVRVWYMELPNSLTSVFIRPPL